MTGRYRRLDIADSIKRKRLTNNIGDFFWANSIPGLAMYFMMLLCAVWALYQIYTTTPVEAFGFFLLWFAAIFSLVSLYTKLIEQKLVCISTANTMEQNKRIIRQFCEGREWDRARGHNQLMVYSTSYNFGMSDLGLVNIDRIFIFNDNKVYFTVILYSERRGTPAALVSYWLMRWRMPRLLKQV